LKKLFFPSRFEFLAAALLPLLVLLLSPGARAAPCCGGGSAIPSLIAGDDRAQFQASVSHGSVIGDTNPGGVSVFRTSGDSEQTDIFRMDGAYRVLDRLQLAAGLPLMRRYRNVNASEAKASGLGDAQLSATYEILPEWSYSAWQPHGFLFVQTTLPTSPSTYDAVAPYQLDARGRGFLSFGVGGVLLKTISDWDFALSLETHRSLPRSVTAADGGALALTPGFGASVLGGAGYSPGGGALRLGLGLSPVWEQGIDAQGEMSSMSAAQLVWSLSASLSYALSSEWSAMAVYSDQTWVGPARNVSLSRTFQASLQKRWAL
jgi:hypothetical protein